MRVLFREALTGAGEAAATGATEDATTGAFSFFLRHGHPLTLYGPNSFFRRFRDIT